MENKISQPKVSYQTQKFLQSDHYRRKIKKAMEGLKTYCLNAKKRVPNHIEKDAIKYLIVPMENSKGN